MADRIMNTSSAALPEILPVVLARSLCLRRGINLSHWFSQVYHPTGYVAEHFESYMKEEDIALIRAMGFDHVRFPIGCEAMMDSSAPGRLPEEYVARIERMIRLILDHGLAVIVDIHPEGPFKERLSKEDHAVAAFLAFWEAFAVRLCHLDAERTFFEILNEPCICDAVRWNQIQNTLLHVIRRVAPSHTLVASGDEWSQLPELLKLQTTEDRNVIYNFHLYDPIAFTHQGAGWSPPWAMFTKGLTYPVDPAFVDSFLLSVTDEAASEALLEYKRENWSAPVYHQFVQPAVEWAHRHGVFLTCNEFGVYKKFSPRGSRLLWLKDLASVFKQNGIGWTMWDYAGDFAVVLQENGKRVPDRDLLSSLGL